MIKPIHSNVLLKRKPPEALYNNTVIVMPETLIFDSFECEVLAVGPGEILKNGEREPMPVDIGDLVIVAQGQGVELEESLFIADITMIEGKVLRQ